MKTFTHRYIALSGLLLCSLFTFKVPVFSQGFSPQTQNRLQQVLDSIQNSATNPVVGGISVAINVDGLAEWLGATGFASRNVDAGNNLLPGGIPMTTATVSHMYSVTKTFTAPLVLELAKEGFLSLDDAVSKFIPFLPFINNELDGSVTIKQLLAHESGWSDYTGEQMTIFAIAAYPTKIFTPFELLSFVHQVAPRGSVRSYSSTNYTTLGAIIEIATGKPVEQHFRERFFTPLGLQSMYLSIREPNNTGQILADPHDNFYPLNPIFQYLGSPFNFPFAWTNVSAFPFTAIHSLAFTGGGLVCNAGDMAKWGNALFGGRATSKSTIESMLSSISATPDQDGDQLGYGIWTNNRVSETDKFVGHNGRAPGYRSLMYYQPDRKMTIAVLTNFSGLDTRLGGLDPYDIAKALYEALPNFIDGNTNRKEAKIRLCFNGNNITIDRNAAASFLRRGAYLGNCSATTEANAAKTVQLFNNSDELRVFPNPVKYNSNITFTTGQAGRATLKLYETNGKEIALLFDQELNQGDTRKVLLKTGGLPAGMYLVQLQTPGGKRLLKVMLER